MVKIALLVGGQIGKDMVISVRNYPNILPVLDTSFSLHKFLKILKRRSVGFSVLINILVFEIIQFRIKKLFVYRGIYNIKTNSELHKFVYKNNVTHVVLFNSNLIITPGVFDPNVELLNIHCINPEKYPGLGGVEKALANEDFVQFAALHKIVSAIDTGLIIFTNSFELTKTKSSVINRRIAFEAGIELFHLWFNRLR